LNGAAKILALNHSTVFRRLVALEDRLGVRLLERGRTGYSSTPAGAAMATLREGTPDLAQAFSDNSIPTIPVWLTERLRKPTTPAGQTAGKRERGYALAALRGCQSELESAAGGERNNTLNAVAFRLGRMIARGWLNREEVESALRAAARACGLSDNEIGSTINSGIEAGITVPHLNLCDKDVQPQKQDNAAQPQKQSSPAASSRDAFESDPTAWSAPDMTHLGTGRANAPSFPLNVMGDERGLWCQEHAQARNAPIDYVAVTLLAAASALIGHSRWAKASGEWKEPPHLWTALVGPPASGKSPSMKAITSLLGSIEGGEDLKAKPLMEKYEKDLVAAKAAKKQYERDVAKALKEGNGEPTSASSGDAQETRNATDNRKRRYPRGPCRAVTESAPWIAYIAR
jgi:hypothetical protein